jgi:tight adherence protein B
MSQSLLPLLYVLLFIAVAVLAQTVQGVWLRSRDRSQRINRRLSLLDSGMTQQQVYSILAHTPAGARNGPGGYWTRLSDRVVIALRQADLTLSPLQLLGIAAVTAGAIWLAGLTVMSVAGHAILLNLFVSQLGAVALTAFGLWFWIRSRQRRRLRRVEAQLPLALDIINRAIRAGHPIVAAVQLAANEMGDPLGSELGLIVDETTYGVEFKEALASFARRTNSDDIRFFAVSVAIQSDTGGNLAEILEGLAQIMRSRATLAKRVKVLGSEGRTSAYILSALPPAMIAFQLVLHPATYTDKFSDPIFWPTIGVVGLLYLSGWMIISRIINFKY